MDLRRLLGFRCRKCWEGSLRRAISMQLPQIEESFWVGLPAEFTKEKKGCYYAPSTHHLYHPNIQHAPLTHRDTERGPRTNKVVIKAPGDSRLRVPLIPKRKHAYV